MSIKRIFVTGASGCIGHYITEALIQETNHELYLFVRNPDKLRFDWNARSGIHLVQADLRDIDKYQDLLQAMDSAILAATAWGGSQAVFDVNVGKTIRLLNLLDPYRCEQVIYFSTASILDRNNEYLKEAGQIGTDYIRSKYDCAKRLAQLAIAPRITTLFPTLVLGGDANHPYSHLSAGLPGVLKWINLIRFLKAEGSFHFIHAYDIAQIVLYLIDHPPDIEGPRKIVLGSTPVTVDQAIETTCAYLNKSIHFRLNLTPLLADILIALFRIKMAAWDRFCLDHRHFTYQDAIMPSALGWENYCETFLDVLKTSGLPAGNISGTGNLQPLQGQVPIQDSHTATAQERDRIAESQEYHTKDYRDFPTTDSRDQTQDEK